jgi:hypothetical protein
MCQRLGLWQTTLGPGEPWGLKGRGVQAGKSPPRGIAGQDRSNWSTTSIWTYPNFQLWRIRRLQLQNDTEVEGGKHLVRKTAGGSRSCSMPLGSLLLSSIGKSGAILTIYMALHQAVKTTGKSTESRPPTSARPAMPSNKMSTSPESYSVTSSGPTPQPLSPQTGPSGAKGGLPGGFCQDIGGNWRILVKYQPMVSQIA